MGEQIKYCPLCGGKAKLIQVEEQQGAVVECTGCHASGPLRIHAKEDANLHAIYSWNRRVDAIPTAEQKVSKAGGGVSLIAKERARQIAKEGWTAQHDDEHKNGELALAALVFASPLPVKVKATVISSCGCRSVGECNHGIFGREQWVDPWPWEQRFFKPDRLRDLVKAGALIAAEIDRLQRQAAEQQLQRQ